MLAVLTEDQKATIKKAGLELDGFDKVVRTLESNPLPKLQDDTASIKVAIDSPALLASLATRFKGLDKDKKDFDRLVTDKTLTKAHKRLTAARLIARWKLENPVPKCKRGETDLNEIDLAEMTKTFGELTSSERLKASAIDLLASAILLPSDTFKDDCFKANHAAGVLAKTYHVPLGVVTLRQYFLTELKEAGHKNAPAQEAEPAE